MFIIIMARARADGDVFVYMGGDQQVPDRVRRARIHKSVKIIRARAFQNCFQLVHVEFHDGIEIIEEKAFYGCWSLKGPIQLLGVRIIKERAFNCCRCLTDVEFGDKLKTIEVSAFNRCTALKSIRIQYVRTIERGAFGGCPELSEVEFGEGLRTLKNSAFYSCYKLKRIALPLKDGMIEDGAFYRCPTLKTVHLVGGIHHTVASLHLESWRNDMNNEINRINQTLPTTDAWHKTEDIQQWMESVINRLNHYKDEHKALLKEATTLLELALWKTKLDVNNEDEVGEEGQTQRARKEIRVTSGASIVIKNVLPFLVFK